MADVMHGEIGEVGTATVLKRLAIVGAVLAGLAGIVVVYLKRPFAQ